MFLNPLLLACGLAALSIPIIAHLQRRRRPVRVPFSSLRLIEECQSIARKRRRITDWPILCLRLFVVALLAMAFARPWISSLASKSPGDKETIVFVLDRSASMQANGELGEVWQEAISKLRESLDETSPNSRVALITTPERDNQTDAANEVRAENKGAIRWMSPRQLLGELDDLQPTLGTAKLNKALQRAASALKRTDNGLPKAVHLLGDLQTRSVANLDEVAFPVNVAIRVTKVGDLNPANVGLAVGATGSGELRSGVYSLQGQTQTEELGELAVQDYDGRGEPMGKSSKEALQARLYSRAYLGEDFGWHSRTLQLDIEDALDMDNQAVDTFYIRERVDVLLVEPRIGAPTYDQATFFLSRAFDPFIGIEDRQSRQTRFIPRTVSVVDAETEIESLAVGKSVVFIPPMRATGGLKERLLRYAESGGAVVFFSGAGADDRSLSMQWNEMLPVQLESAEKIESRVTLGYIGDEHPLWGGLDESIRSTMIRLPFFERFRCKPLESAEVLASFSNGTPLVVQKKIGKGCSVFVNTSADRTWSDWPAFAGSFVPTLHLLAAQTLPENEQNWDADVQLTYRQDLRFPLGPAFANQTFNVSTIPCRELPVDGKQYKEMATSEPADKALTRTTRVSFLEESEDAAANLSSALAISNLPLLETSQPVSIKSNDDGELAMPSITAPAIYTVRDMDGDVIRQFTVNLDPDESDLKSLQGVVVQQQLQSQRAAVTGEEAASLAKKGSDGVVWKSFIALLAVLLAVEPFLANSLLSNPQQVKKT